MVAAAPLKPRYFATPAAFRIWLAAHHATERELLVGYHKVGSGEPSIPQVEREAPSYKKAASWWVISAKRPETRERRLAQLIDDCAAGLRIKQMRR